MDDQLKEIYQQLKSLEDSFAAKRNNAIAPLQGISWDKLKTTTKLKKSAAVDFLKIHDTMLYSLLEGIGKVRKDFLSVIDPGATEEGESSGEQTVANNEVSHEEGEVTDGDANTPEEEEEQEEVTQPNTSEVCPYYLRNRCRHGGSGTKVVGGVSCTKKHPPMCRKFSNYGTTRHLGCTKGSSCKYFHRPLCRSSELKRECFNQDCTNHHLKHTRRFQAEEGWQIAGDRRKRSPKPKQPEQKQKQQQGINSRQNARSRNSYGKSRDTHGAVAGDSTGEDFCKRLLDQLTQSIPQLVAEEISRQLQPKPQMNPFKWQLPVGMTMTRSPHA